MDPASLLEEIRFGYGPRAARPLGDGGVDADRVLAQLTADDPSGRAWDRPTLASRYILIDQYEAEKATAAGVQPATVQTLKALQVADIDTFVGRPAFAAAGFVERLVNLWANRITISNASGGIARYVQSFRDEAIRPHIAGRYGDMLKATLWHPGMQFYLTQASSFGPDSIAGKRKGRGLNENLAREFLELHSMGAGYSQADITELARLLAGMQNGPMGPQMDFRALEPGVKLILGGRYGDDDPVGEINRLVEIVALRPETALSVARMLARHFSADTPPSDLVQALSRAYRDAEGALLPVYATLLRHPSVQNPELHKLRSPQEYVAATLRAFGLQGQERGLTGKKNRSLLVPQALSRMGQPVFRARRPDGWPEVSAGWMTPPMMASRIDWAVDLGRAMGAGSDPIALARHLIGDLAGPDLHRAVAGAEQRWEGLALLLASPDFMRR